MLNVASEATIQILNRARQLAAQPAQAPATPFSSMLDDSQAAAEPPKQPAADDKVRNARTESDPPPAKTSDNKPASTDKADAGKDAQKTAKTSDGKTAETDAADAGKDTQNTVTTGVQTSVQTSVQSCVQTGVKTGVKTGIKINAKASAVTDTMSDATVLPDPAAKTDQSDKPADGKSAVDAKTVTTATSTDDKPTDSKPAASAPSDASGVQPNDPTPVIKAADAPVAVVVPTIAPTQAPPIAANHGDTPAPKADALTALQTDNGKATDGISLTAKTATAVHGETKPQGPASSTDDDAVAHARGEPSDSGHHSFAAQVLATDTTAASKTIADIAPQSALPAPMQTSPAMAANPTTAAPPLQAAAIPLAGVAIEIASKAADGKNHFEIRLDPPELGRIEVRLAVDRDGNVTSRLIADRADTLDLLRRDANGLERALQDAGLKTSDNGLQFSLRDQSAYQQQQQQQQQGQTRDTAHIVLEDETLAAAAADASQRSYGRLAGLGRGLDIQV